MARFTANKEVDWASVEAMYRAGVLSNRAIAEEHGISEGMVRKQAKKCGWIKAEGQLVRTRAHDLANDKAIPRYIAPSPERVEALAQVGADVLVRHRESTATLQGLLQEMVAQLTDQTRNESDLAQCIEEFFMEKARQSPLLAGAYKQQCNSALHAIGLGSRSKTMLNLVGAADKLVGMERKAWNLDDEGDRRTYEDLLAEIEAKVRAKAA